MRIERRFTTAEGGAYDGVAFAERDSRLTNADGTVAFETSGITVPAPWSQLATDIIAQKYFRRAGVPRETVRVAEENVPEWLRRSEPAAGVALSGETDAREPFDRMTGTWTYWGWKYGYFDSEDDALAFRDELANMLATQRAAPNSPQWFNTGLHWAYGITGPPQGHHFVDPASGDVVRASSAYERPQPHACFIQSVADDLVGEGGIMDLWQREARIFKYGSGTGTNFSTLRARGEPLSGGGKSSGLMSFLKIGDRAAGAIQSGGTTRRAAKMVIVDVDHPDIEEFIDWKVSEERKVATMIAGSRLLRSRITSCAEAALEGGTDAAENPALARALSLARRDGVPEIELGHLLRRISEGAPAIDFPHFDADWQGEAYRTVSGQNANNSVRVNAAFMEAVREDREWHLVRRTDGGVAAVVRARDLWDRIADAAWRSADPGVQYDSTINEWHTSPDAGRIRGSNPCSEYLFVDDTACNLASLNLLAFRDPETGAFDIEGYAHAARLWTIVLEISVLMAQYPSQDIARLSHEYRTLGLGYANIGTLLMVQGIPYDSPEALAQGAAYTAILTGESYAASAEMAAEIGPFPAYEANRDSMLRVIRNHRRAVIGSPPDEYEGLTATPMPLDATLCPPDLARAARRAWDRALELGERHGYRNAQATLIAPTGTIGLLMDCDTTGVEPDFALVKYKKLAGGGGVRIINQSVPEALRAMGYSRDEIADIRRYVGGTASLDGAPHIDRQAMRRAGIDAEALRRVEGALPGTVDVSFAFSPHLLGPETCERLGLTPEVMADPAFTVLGALGFTARQVAEANNVIVGHGTVEGAPHLRAEHYAVFDCANRAGRGLRFIAPMAHVRMMAAIQPFLSGAISKTVNLPDSASVEDIRDVYAASAALMLKAVAVYRDGSKLSQPLAALVARDDDEDEAAAVSAGDVPADAASEIQRLLAGMPTRDARDAVRASVGLLRGERHPLPTQISSLRQKVHVGGFSLFIHSGEYENGQLGEIFMAMGQEGSAFSAMMNAFAIAISIGLQYGVPLDAYTDAYVGSRFEPAGPVTGHHRVRMASSLLDYVFRHLAIRYLDRDDLAQDGGAGEAVPSQGTLLPYQNGNAQPDLFSVGAPDSTPAAQEPADGGVQGEIFPGARNGSPEPALSPTPALAAAGAYGPAAAAARESAPYHTGFTGDACPECGLLTMVRSGTCLKCMSCAATSGCS